MGKSKKKSSDKSIVPSTPSSEKKRRGRNHETPDHNIEQKRRMVSNGHFESNFEKGEMLGQGKSGQAYECTHYLTKQKRAIKMVSVDFGKKRNFEDTNAAREVEILSEHKKSHHIVEYAHSWIEEDPEKEGKYTLYVVMELCEGSLRDYMTKKGESLCLRQKLSIIIQIAEAVEYLHGSEIIHRDLTMENCFYVKSEDSENPRFMLGDFGHGRKVSLGIGEMLTPMKVRDVETGNYDKEVDVSLPAKLSWHTSHQ